MSAFFVKSNVVRFASGEVNLTFRSLLNCVGPEKQTFKFGIRVEAGSFIVDRLTSLTFDVLMHGCVVHNRLHQFSLYEALVLLIDQEIFAFG